MTESGATKILRQEIAFVDKQLALKPSDRGLELRRYLTELLELELLLAQKPKT